jgi:hypothetical protein
MHTVAKCMSYLRARCQCFFLFLLFISRKIREGNKREKKLQNDTTGHWSVQRSAVSTERGTAFPTSAQTYENRRLAAGVLRRLPGTIVVDAYAAAAGTVRRVRAGSVCESQAGAVLGGGRQAQARPPAAGAERAACRAASWQVMDPGGLTVPSAAWHGNMACHGRALMLGVPITGLGATA